jgi:hypothetical protein
MNTEQQKNTLVERKTLVILKHCFGAGGGQLFAVFGCSRIARVLEPNLGEKRSTTLITLSLPGSSLQYRLQHSGLDYTFNIRGGEVADQARRFIVIRLSAAVGNSVMCASCYVVSAHVNYHLQVQCEHELG